MAPTGPQPYPGGDSGEDIPEPLGCPGSIGSVVSTFLVTFGVVAAAVVCVVAIVLGDPDQPATVRGSRRRASPSPDRRARPHPRRQRAGAWLRLRSGLALVVLVAFVGILFAAVVGTSLALAARALRQAVG